MYGEDCYFRPIGEIIESTWIYNNKLRQKTKKGMEDPGMPKTTAESDCKLDSYYRPSYTTRSYASRHRIVTFKQ